MLVSCKKQDIRDDLYRNGWSEMDSISDRSFFPPNITTWIYEDSATNSRDTVSLIELNTDTTEVYYSEYPDILYYTKVQKIIVLYSSRSNKLTYYSSRMGNPFTSEYSTINKSVNVGNYLFAHVPVTLKLKHQTPFGISGVVRFYDTYTVNGVLYPNVAEIEQLGEPGMNYDHINYFFSPNNGLIKSVNQTTNQVWLLKQCF